jgi:hypothetical protein
LVRLAVDVLFSLAEVRGAQADSEAAVREGQAVAAKVDGSPRVAFFAVAEVEVVAEEEADGSDAKR